MKPVWIFGNNISKFPDIMRKRTPISLHRVPPVRSNKVKDYISSVGSPCRGALHKEMAKAQNYILLTEIKIMSTNIIKCNVKIFLPMSTNVNTSLAGKGALAHRLQSHTAWKIQNGRQGGPKMADKVWKGVYPLLFGHSRQLSLISFLIRAILLWEKVTTEKKNGGKNGK